MDIILALGILAVFLLMAAWASGFKVFKSVTVLPYEHAILYVPGQPAKVLTSGRHWYRHGQVFRIEARPITTIVPEQQVLTKERITIRLSLTVVYKVADAVTAHQQSADFRNALQRIGQDSMRKAVASKNLDDVVEKTAEIESAILDDLKRQVVPLGVEVLSMTTRDLILPAKLRSAYAGLVEARKLAETRLVAARGEHAVLRSLANTAKSYQDNPALLEARLAHAISTGNNDVVFHPDGGFSVTPKSE